MIKRWVVVIFDNRLKPPVRIHGIHESREEALTGRRRACQQYSDRSLAGGRVCIYVLSCEQEA